MTKAIKIVKDKEGQFYFQVPITRQHISKLMENIEAWEVLEERETNEHLSKGDRP